MKEMSTNSLKIIRFSFLFLGIGFIYIGISQDIDALFYIGCITIPLSILLTVNRKVEDMRSLRLKYLIKSKIFHFMIPLFLAVVATSYFATEKQKEIIHPLIALCMIALLVYNFRKTMKDNIIITKQKEELETQKTIIEEKQKEILESIEYALRIQTAILPPEKIVKQYLENSFILYKPKDIVAGDFYWMESVGDSVLFAACDCTGHGVPGAMVSVVCHNALNRAVREFGLTQPAAILDKTSEIVKENFAKSEEDIKDGMDISLCSFNIKTNKLEWAGANNPLWLINNQELAETKADKQSIGNSEDSKPFTNHTFTLKTGENIYIFSDGFQDQFGGDGEKKFTKKRFKELLLTLQNLTMQAQGIAIDKFIIDYRKETEQTDDILVMGVKV